MCIRDSSITERLPHLRHMLYDEPRGLRDYDHSKLHAIETVIADGAKALKDPQAQAALANEMDQGQGSDLGIILYTLSLIHI